MKKPTYQEVYQSKNLKALFAYQWPKQKFNIWTWIKALIITAFRFFVPHKPPDKFAQAPSVAPIIEVLERDGTFKAAQEAARKNIFFPGYKDVPLRKKRNFSGDGRTTIDYSRRRQNAIDAFNGGPK